ncbi:hypothetical protein BLA13014_02764 [Burkholderia aenigmatica]|uniref:Fimbrial-type adhesion domain-containing protein n=1 Tax=Burkholderia aenigmatica TaxID=2015348 RepID=A0A6P2L588_9BURK|nr:MULTISPECIES: hypothetical protein [Burkholderia]VWB61935.1 hypothetical protein BLA13014_02764 [Burkholderia aenigmatica]
MGVRIGANAENRVNGWADYVYDYGSASNLSFLPAFIFVLELAKTGPIMSRSPPVSFSRDSSATGNPNQWFVTEAGDKGVNIPLTAHYIRTGNMKAGAADTVATFTMSYQ